MQIIHGALADLGYARPELPSIVKLGGHLVSNLVFLGQGKKAGSSYVYRADTDEGHVILKLNHTAREVSCARDSLAITLISLHTMHMLHAHSDAHSSRVLFVLSVWSRILIPTEAALQLLQAEVLETLGAVSNVVQLLGEASVIRFKNQDWHAVLIRPFGRLLATTDTVRLYKQAAYDIAAAIKDSFARNVRHQDISPYNMVLHEDRMFLTDWSAGKVSQLVFALCLHLIPQHL